MAKNVAFNENEKYVLWYYYSGGSGVACCLFDGAKWLAKNSTINTVNRVVFMPDAIVTVFDCVTKLWYRVDQHNGDTWCMSEEIRYTMDAAEISFSHCSIIYCHFLSLCARNHYLCRPNKNLFFLKKKVLSSVPQVLFDACFPINFDWSWTTSQPTMMHSLSIWSHKNEEWTRKQ